MIFVGCDRVGVEVRGGGGLVREIVSTMLEFLRAGGPSSRIKFPGASCGE